MSVAAPWDGFGMRANASAPIALKNCEVTPAGQLTEDGCGFPAMINTVLSSFNLRTASVALGLCRAAVATTEITGICADFMVELRGFEPLASPVLGAHTRP